MIKTIDECIDLLKRQNELENLTDNEIEELLVSMSPFIIKRYGKVFMIQIEKLCMARNFDRAVKLLESLPKTRFYLPKGKGVFIEAFIIMMLIGVGGLAFFFSSSDSGSVQGEDLEISWIKTEGIINHSRITSNSSFESGSSEYSPDIRYSFNVEGTRYSADSLVFDSSSDPMKIVENYYEGDIVDIQYNAGNPEQSFLNVQSKLESANWFSYIIILAGIVGMFYFINQVVKKRKLFKDRL